MIVHSCSGANTLGGFSCHGRFVTILCSYEKIYTPFKYENRCDVIKHPNSHYLFVYNIFKHVTILAWFCVQHVQFIIAPLKCVITGSYMSHSHSHKVDVLIPFMMETLMHTAGPMTLQGQSACRALLCAMWRVLRVTFML